MWVNIRKCYNHLKDFGMFFTTFNGKLNYLNQEYHTCIYLYIMLYITLAGLLQRSGNYFLAKLSVFFWKKVRHIFHCFPFFNIYDNDDDDEEE